MGACARNMLSDPAEIKPAQCCIKLVFHLTYTMKHGNTKLKFFFMFLLSALANFTQNSRNLMALSMTYKQYRLCDLNIVLEIKGA